MSSEDGSGQESHVTCKDGGGEEETEGDRGHRLMVHLGQLNEEDHDGDEIQGDGEVGDGKHRRLGQQDAVEHDQTARCSETEDDPASSFSDSSAVSKKTK